MHKRIAISLGGLTAVGLTAIGCQIIATKWWFDATGGRDFSWALLLKIVLKWVVLSEGFHTLAALSILVLAILLTWKLEPADGPP